MEITRREVVDADEAFLLLLYGVTREIELGQVPWSPEQKQAFVKMQFEAQRRHYLATYPQGMHEVICSDGKPVGRLWTAEFDDEFRILDIVLVHEFRGKGIGAQVVRQLVSVSDRLNKPLRVWIETWNPSQQIFRHLGFEPLKDDGVNVLWECKCEKAAAS